MSFRWSEDTTTKFVEHYLKHECLWNIKSVAYKNKQIKNSAYEDFEKTMNISGFKEKEIKSKIKNLRSTYSQELKKIKDSKKSGAATDTIYVPTIKWFKIMDESLRNINSILTESESNLLQNASKQNRYNRSSTPSSFESQPSPSNSITSNPTSTYYTEDYYSEEQHSQEIPFTPQYSTTDGLILSNILAEAMTDADV
ncbi:hypothetical protein FQA39_LY15336 [Lamprigera yunnana]|nr:hypothetical protein FQA39_LY15336 [Lamprigera yunnana]